MPYLQGTFEERCHTTGAPSYLSFLSASISIILLATNIPGNIILILAVALDPRKNLRSPFNYLMSNLAIADLVAGVVTGPLSVNYHIKEGLNSHISAEEIRLFHMSYFVSCTASILSLASLAIERYLAIKNPHSYRNKLTGKRILGTVTLIWLISLSLPFVYFEVGFITCAFILANTTVFLALGIICFTHGQMIWKFKTAKTPFLGTECQMVNMRAHNNGRDDNKSRRDVSRRRDKTLRRETRITKMFLVVMAAVLGCYGTSAILIYTMSFCKSCDCETLHWCRDLQCILILMNSSVNFFCYGLRSPRFRQAFVMILRLPGSKKLAANNVSNSTPSSESQPLKNIHT